MFDFTEYNKKLIEYIDKKIIEEPNNDNYYFLRGLLEFFPESKISEEGLKCWLKAAEINPKDIYFANIAKAYYINNGIPQDLEKALFYIEKAIEDKSNTDSNIRMESIINKIAIISSKEKSDVNNQFKYFSELLDKNNSENIYENMMEYVWEKFVFTYDLLINYIIDYIEDYKDKEVFFYVYAKCLLDINDYINSVKIIDKAIEINPKEEYLKFRKETLQEFRNKYYDYGIPDNDEGKINISIREFTYAIDYGLDYHIERAFAYDQLGDYDNSLKDWNNAINNAEAKGKLLDYLIYYQRLTSYLCNKNYKEIIEKQKDFERKYTEEDYLEFKEGAYEVCAISYFYLKDFDNSFKYFKKIEKDSDIDDRYKLIFAIVSYKTGNSNIDIFKEITISIKDWNNPDKSGNNINLINEDFFPTFIDILLDIDLGEMVEILKNIFKIKEIKINLEELKNLIEEKKFKEIKKVLTNKDIWESTIEIDHFLYDIENIDKVLLLSRIKLVLIINILSNIDVENKYLLNFSFKCLISTQNKYNDIIKQKEQEKAQLIIEERDKVIADLSHSIKNLIATVKDPLENLRSEAKDYTKTIDDAISGTKLIRDIVNAMNLSYVGSIEDFYEDAKSEDENKIALKDIIINAVISAVPNMFDKKYFNDFQKRYFPTREIFIEAKTEWQKVSQKKEPKEIIDYLNKYMFDIKLDFVNIDGLALSDKKGSVVKMMILTQEMVLNAIKYSSFIERDRRIVNIRLEKSDKIKFEIENRYKKDIITKKSGLGHVIINNFAKLLKTEPLITTNDDIFKIELNIPDLWR